MASMPIITFFIGRSPMSLESLAVLPIIESFVFIFRSVGFAYQEVGLALLGPRNEQNKPLRTFGVTVGLTTSGIYSLLVFTPLIHPVLSGLYGLSDELASFAVLPSRIVVILPFLAISFAYFRSIMMNNRRNAIVTYSTMIEVGGMIALIFLTVTLFKPVGIIAAAIGLSFGRLGAQWFLLWMYRRVMPARSEQ
jgi:membrane protein insertase Oxa1/YidC/SpoIIIJ